MHKFLLFALGLTVSVTSASALDFGAETELIDIQPETVFSEEIRSVYDEKGDGSIVCRSEVKPLSDDATDYGEWVDYQTADITEIRKFFVLYGFNDVQTAVDNGIVNVQRRVSASSAWISQLKFENVFGEVDLIAEINDAEGSFIFPDQDTGITNTRGGSYETLHFYTQYYPTFSFYEDGFVHIISWALINPSQGFRNTRDTYIVFPGEWEITTELGRYVPNSNDYNNLKKIVSNLGNPDAVWEDAIEVDCCVNKYFPNRQRYTFHKLFGGSDVYIDRRVSTGEFLTIMIPQKTGFILGGEYFDGTEELTFFPGYSVIFERSHTFNLGLNLIEDPATVRTDYISILFTSEDHEPLASSIDGSNFISSTQRDATVKALYSGEVDEWRLYVLKSDSDRREFLNAMQGNEANVSYLVVNEGNVTIQCDTLGVSNSLYLTPMGIVDGKMKQAGPYSSFRVCRNVPLEGEWEEWGEGKMVDVVAFPHLGYCVTGTEMNNSPAMSPAERPVRIERRKDAPGIIRIPDPYKGNYPYKDGMRMFDTDDIFYLVINTTDPSRVTAERTLTGTSDGSVYGFYVYDPEYSEYGKCFDKKVVFNNNLSWNTAYPFKPDNMPQLTLELPEYKDYTVTIDTADNMVDKIDVGNMSENVVSVDMALVPADEYNSYYPERMCELVMNGSDGLFVHNYPVKAGETLSVEIAELAKSNSRSVDALPSGRYRVVAVPRDADGNQHYGPVSEEVTYTAPWKYLGIAEINDWAIMVVFNYPEGGFNITAEAYEDPFNPGVYMLKDCYKDYAEQFKASIPMAEFGEYEPTSMYIDARDPDKVNLVANEVLDPFATNRGFNTGVFLNLGPDYEGYNGYQYLNTYGNAMGSEDEIRYGKKEGDYITFDRNSLVTSWTGGSQFYYIKNSLNIKLPGNGDSGVGNIADDDNSMYPVEWYNLQGMRINIDNAPAGIYIRRQGMKSEKVYFRK